MSSQAIGNVNSLEHNKKLLTENHFFENSRYIAEKGDVKFTQEDFNQEGYKVKEKLQNKINDFIPMGSTYLVSNYSLKEEEMINKNKYARNINNTKILEQEISKIQHADAKVNGRSSSNADSLHDFFKEVKDSIVTGKSDYLDVLKDVFSKYMDFVNELREILASISEFVSSGDDDNHISFKRKDFYKKLKEFIDKYSSSPNNDLYLGELIFQQDSNGRYYREINGEKIYSDDIMKPVDAIKNLLKDIKGGSVSVNELPGPPIKFEIHFKIDLSNFDKLLSLVLDGLSEDILNMFPDGTDFKILSSEFNLLKNGIDAFEKK